ncbi:hypothetical protein ACFL3Q_15940 [Planctomycetota bacterium]
MPYEIAYDMEADCMMCRMFCKIDTPLVKAFTSDVVSLMDKHQCTRILNDLREADLSLSTFEIYDIPRLVTETSLKNWFPKALVVSKELDDYLFFESVSHNSGQNVKVFRDIDEAKSWLAETKTTS